MNKLIEFLQTDDGQMSNTRLTILLMVLSYIGWASWIVWHTKQIPDLPIQVAGLLAALYAVNKIGPNVQIGGGNGAQPNK